MKCEQCNQVVVGTPSKDPRTKVQRVVVKQVEGPDGMSSWVVALSAFIINFIMAGLSRMSGILYVAFIEMFHTDRKGASMPFSVRSATMNLLGPVVGILGQKYGVRLVSISGGIVGTLSAAACFYAEDITWITVLWGGLNGAGTALVTTLTTVMISQYFDAYRTTASGLSFSGACIGSFIFPPLMEYLLHAYGLEGSFLIIAGIIMHTIPAAMILRKPVWVKRANRLAKDVESANVGEKDSTVKSCKVNENVSNDVDLEYLRNNSRLVLDLLTKDYSVTEKDKSQVNNPSRDELLREMEEVYSVIEAPVSSPVAEKPIQPEIKFEYETSPVSSKSRNARISRESLRDKLSSINLQSTVTRLQVPCQNLPQKTFILPKLKELSGKSENQIVSSFSDQSLYKKILKELKKLHKVHEAIKNGNMSAKTVVKVHKVQQELKPEKTTESNGIWENIKKSMNLHRNPLFLLVSLCRAVHFTTFIPVVTIIVDYAMDKGFMEDDGKYIIIALSVGDLLGRLCLGWVTDSGFISLPRYMLVAMVVQGGFTALLPITNTLLTFLPAIVAYAMLQGSVFVRHSVLLCNYMKKSEQSIASGCVNFFAGLLGFAVPSYIGFFRDTMGSYDGVFYVNGAVGAVTGLLWIFEPFFLKLSMARDIPEINEPIV